MRCKRNKIFFLCWCKIWFVMFVEFLQVFFCANIISNIIEHINKRQISLPVYFFQLYVYRECLFHRLCVKKERTVVIFFQNAPFVISNYRRKLKKITNI